MINSGRNVYMIIYVDGKYNYDWSTHTYVSIDYLLCRKVSDAEIDWWGTSKRYEGLSFFINKCGHCTYNFSEWNHYNTDDVLSKVFIDLNYEYTGIFRDSGHRDIYNSIKNIIMDRVREDVISSLLS